MNDLIKAAEMALDALDMYREHDAENIGLADAAYEALRQALSQPEQESVICRNIYEVWAGSEGILRPLTSKEAYLLGLVEQMRDEAKKGLKPLYTAPPKREWVGLTDDEAWECWNWEDFNETWKKMETKLKEKNGG